MELFLMIKIPAWCQPIILPKDPIAFIAYVSVVEKQFKGLRQAAQVHITTDYRGW